MREGKRTSWEKLSVIVIDVTDDGEDRILLGPRALVTANGVTLGQSRGDGPVPSHTHTVSESTSH